MGAAQAGGGQPEPLAGWRIAAAARQLPVHCRCRPASGRRRLRSVSRHPTGSTPAAGVRGRTVPAAPAARRPRPSSTLTVRTPSDPESRRGRQALCRRPLAGRGCWTPAVRGAPECSAPSGAQERSGSGARSAARGRLHLRAAGLGLRLHRVRDRRLRRADRRLGMLAVEADRVRGTGDPPGRRPAPPGRSSGSTICHSDAGSQYQCHLVKLGSDICPHFHRPTRRAVVENAGN